MYINSLLWLCGVNVNIIFYMYIIFIGTTTADRNRVWINGHIL